ncbi:hypothetical protein F4827_005692 [Paraburkholderia bannensis]|uniref:Lipoprotein n=1 Tax=Paraburkholderia bannensis TaxID=765414 RepID=A0A7W9WVY8_9BURK|nr:MULTISPECIES: hypothetical protein [Paraburkholderia]MBB3260652.1 hypothetical protein [Paraburkholderia sp. WP4_3_2]MBB6105822.1 hypothetical protein [Paraburkholderia bannensis]
MKKLIALAGVVALATALSGCCLMPFCGPGWGPGGGGPGGGHGGGPGPGGPGGPQGAVIVPHASSLA